MRDKETDSWWSIMASKAIEGEMHGESLRELPHSTKTTWGEWRRRHPDTLVLSIDGRTYEEENPYAPYFADPEKTYRDIRPEDDRLPAKEPIYAFRLDGEPIAVAHRSCEGGLAFSADAGSDESPVVLLYRSPGAPLFESTVAYRFPKSVGTSGEDVGALRARIERAVAEGRTEDENITVIAGIDTYWYSWVPQNENTRVVR